MTNIIGILITSTVTAAFISGIVNLITTNKKIKPEIISKNRIERIEQISNISSEFITSIHECVNAGSNFLTIAHKNIDLKKNKGSKSSYDSIEQYEEYERFIKETESIYSKELENYNNAKGASVKNLNLLKLLLFQGKNSNLLIAYAELVDAYANQIGTDLSSGFFKEYNEYDIQEYKENINEKLSDKIRLFSDECKKYLKTEWDLAQKLE